MYANLRKAVRYYLAAKAALVTASLVAVLAHLPVPFEPVQIIVLTAMQSRRRLTPLLLRLNGAVDRLSYAFARKRGQRTASKAAGRQQNLGTAGQVS